ncbi:MAG: VWA domain-containing protein [Verrucomicrobiota bacterium]
MPPQNNQLAIAVEFADNPEPRCPCVLLLDTSSSMEGEKLRALQDGLRAFKEDLIKDNLAAKRVEVAVIEFNSTVSVIQDFVTADEFRVPTLSAGGLTHMGSGINMALDMVKTRKAQYKSNGISYYRPWIFMITDGEPQGESDTIVQQAARRVKTDEETKKVAFFAVGVGEANMTRLSEIISVRQPVLLRGLNFVEMFIWLSRSTQLVSHSQVDKQETTQLALPPPGWINI